MPDLTDAITNAAGEPVSMSNDTGSSTQRSIGDLIDADRYLAGKAAQQGAASDGRLLGRALRMAKAVPPSALGS